MPSTLRKSGLAAVWSGRRRPHPLIVVACFLVFVLAMAGAGPSTALAGLASMLVVTVSRGGICRDVIGSLRRLRWFFLSMGLLYCWGTPGEALWPVVGVELAPWWMPSREGAMAACERMAAFAAVVLASRALLDGFSRDDLLLAIQGLVSPLGRIGFPCQRLSLRLLLVLEVIGEVQGVVVRCLAARDRAASAFIQFGQLAARVFAEVVEQADLAPLTPIRLPAYRPPPRWQWSFPVALGLGAGLLG